MGKRERYSVTLDKEIVNETMEYAQKWGGKLSPLINILLEKWLKEQKKKGKNQ